MFFTSSCSTFLESGNDLDCNLDKAERLLLLAAPRVSGHPQPGSAAHCPCPMLPDRHHHVLLLQKAPNCRRSPPSFFPKPGGKQHTSVSEVQCYLGWRVALEPRGTPQAISSLFNMWAHGPSISLWRHRLQELLCWSE